MKIEIPRARAAVTREKIDADAKASCEDQRKQLRRIADSLERLERFFIDKE